MGRRSRYYREVYGVKLCSIDDVFKSTSYYMSFALFSSCRYGILLDRRDFAPLLRVITVVPMPSFLRMTLPVRTPLGAFQSG